MPGNDKKFKPEHGDNGLKHVTPSSPRNGFAVVAGGAVALATASKDGRKTGASHPSRLAEEARTSG
jgi:hypothetical protein